MNGFTSFPSDNVARSLPAVFEDAVRLHARNLAVKVGDEALDYDALNRSANRVARLILSRGVAHQQPVAVLLPKSCRAVAAMIGVLKAGMVLVPIDTAWPDARIRYILEDTRASLLVTCSEFLEKSRRSAEGLAQLVDLDLSETPLSDENPAVPIAPDALSFLLYTSGSTGTPKGVMQNHRNLLHAVMEHVNSLRIAPGDRLLCPSSLAFLGAIRSMLSTLLVGASFYPVRLEDLHRLTDLMRREHITIWHAPCSFLRHFLGTLQGPPDLPELLRFYCGAEPLYRSDVLRWRELFGPEPVFIYPLVITEADIVRRFVIDRNTRLDEEKVPLGYPVADAEVLLLDDAGNPVPPGGIGQIVVRSRYLSPGYWNKPDLTSARFIPDPLDPSLRRYLTGDLGRMRPDGCLEYHGRADFQVKIRGNLVQSAEVDSALRQIELLKDALVVPLGAGADQRLVAYCVPASPEHPPTVTTLRSRLQQKLPEFMIPSAFVFLDRIPITATGKVDRSALPRPDNSRPALNVPFQAPDSDAHRTIADTWSALLRVSPVGVNDNFFDLGGDSLLATQAVVRLCDAFNVNLPLTAIFEAPTVALLSDRIASAASSASCRRTPSVTPSPRNGPIPIAFPQHMLWVLNGMVPGFISYNIPLAMRLAGPLDVPLLERCLNEIISRHEALRTVFSTVQGRPVQVVLPEMPLKIDLVDLSALPDAVREDQARQRLLDESRRFFSLERGPLVRAVVIRLARDSHLFLLSIHHIVFDGWSIEPLHRELAALYRAFSAGEPSPLKPLPIQYADFALWQHRSLRAENLAEDAAYWTRHLAGMPKVLDLPSDRPRKFMRNFKGARRTVVLPRDTWSALESFSRNHNATLFMTMLSAFHALLARHTGRFDQVVGSPIAARQHVELEPLIGFFMNTLVLRNDLSGDPAFSEILSRVRTNTLAAYEHQELPFQELYDLLKPIPDTSHLPLVQALFILQNTPGRNLDLPGLSAEPVEIDTATAKCDLSCIVYQEPRGLRILFEYPRDIFEPATVDRLQADYVRLLAAVLANPTLRLSEIPIGPDSA